MNPTIFNEYLSGLSDNEVIQFSKEALINFPTDVNFIVTYLDMLTVKDREDSIKYISSLSDSKIKHIMKDAELPQQMKNDEKIVKTISEAILDGTITAYDADRLEGMTLEDLQGWIFDLVNGLTQKGGDEDYDPDYINDRKVSFVTKNAPLKFDSYNLEDNITKIVINKQNSTKQVGGNLNFNNYEIQNIENKVVLIKENLPLEFIEYNLPGKTERVVLSKDNKAISFNSYNIEDNDTRVILNAQNTLISFDSYKIEDRDNKVVEIKGNTSAVFNDYKIEDRDNRVVNIKDNTSVSFNNYELNDNNSSIIIQKDNTVLSFNNYELEDKDNSIIVHRGNTSISFDKYEIEDNCVNIILPLNNNPLSFNNYYKVEDNISKGVLPKISKVLDFRPFGEGALIGGDVEDGIFIPGDMPEYSQGDDNQIDWEDLDESECLAKLKKVNAVSKSKEFLCYEGQTEFYGLSYVPGFLFLFMEGKLLAQSDYIAKDGKSAKLKIPAQKNDTILAMSFNTFHCADTFTKDEILDMLTKYKSAAPELSSLPNIAENTTRVLYIKNYDENNQYSASVTLGDVKIQGSKIIITAPDYEQASFITLYVTSKEDDKETSNASTKNIAVQNLDIIGDDYLIWEDETLVDDPQYIESYKNGSITKNEFVSEATDSNEGMAVLTGAKVHQDDGDYAWKFAKATSKIIPSQYTILDHATSGSNTYYTSKFLAVIEGRLDINERIILFTETDPEGFNIILNNKNMTDHGTFSTIDVREYNLSDVPLRAYSGNQNLAISLADTGMTSFDMIQLNIPNPKTEFLEFLNLGDQGISIDDNNIVQINNIDYNIKTTNIVKDINPTKTLIPHSSIQSSLILERINSTSINYQDNILIIGGNNGISFFNDVSLLNINTNILQVVAALPTELQDRIDMNVIHRNDKLYIMGGKKLDTETNTFKEDKTIGILDLITTEFTVFELPFLLKEYKVVEYNYKLYFIGGKDSNDDWNTNIYIYDLNDYEFTLESSTVFGPRVGHCCALYQDNIMVYGGYDVNGEVNELYQYMISTNAWIKKTPSSGNSDTTPEIFTYGKMVNVDNFIIMYGGSSSSQENTESVGDIKDEFYVWDMYSQDWIYSSNLDYFAVDFEMVLINNSLYIVQGKSVQENGELDYSQNIVKIRLFDIYTNIKLLNPPQDYSDINSVLITGDVLQQQPVSITEIDADTLNIEYSGIISESDSAREIQFQYKSSTPEDKLNSLVIKTYM